MKYRVVVTGIGIISPLGNNVIKNWESLLLGRSVIKNIQRFDASTFQTRIAGEITGFDARQYIQEKTLKRTRLGRLLPIESKIDKIKA